MSTTHHNCRRAVSPRPSLHQHKHAFATPPAPDDVAVGVAPVSSAFCRSLRKDTPEVERLVTKIRAGLELGIAPLLIPEGEGGTYLLFDAARRPVAIFKPSDEEPPAENNPKKHAESPSRKGIIPGDGAIRETAAYLLDRGWAGVPPTTMLEIRHPCFGPGCKVGSVQEWIHDSEPAGGYGPSLFSVADVHRIGILDVRTLNTDRHDGNLLVTKSASSSSGEGGRLRLLPIDHGFVLPAQPGEAYFDWLNWPQTRQPFSPDELEYIARIDLDADTKTLRKLGLNGDCLRTYRMAVTLLKCAAAAGLTLHDIGTMVCRPASDPDTPSALEDLAEDASGAEDFWHDFEELTAQLVVARKAAASLPAVRVLLAPVPVRALPPKSAQLPRSEPMQTPPSMHRSTSLDALIAAV